NAFLKTLEEPPPYAIFILATTEKHKILPTILSRCQIFDFKRITTNDTVVHLQEIVTKESIDADKSALQVIAQKSEGCMRDSLSLLDKLVSFTNGRLTYQNTLEHLNILDDDYFFQLLDLLLAQDMAGAMLLFDQINRKGFEGDLVLNGFAEFIRNVLVCKDAKAAALLDVVEGQEARYQAVAAKTTTSYLVSALNVLNDTEVQYKMARNKRLHIELALIKLSFLQQALTLTVEQGKVLKKRQVDQSLSLRLQPIASLAPSTASPLAAAAVTPQQASPSSTNTEAKLFVDRSLLPPLPDTNKAKPSMLDMIRQKVGQSYTVNEIPEALPLTQEALLEFWQGYTGQLEKQLKHSAAGTFKIAGLVLDNEQHFTVRVTALTAQKFIEQEKTELLDQLQRKFNNRSIQFDVLVEAGEQENVPLHLRLTSREKFEHLAKTYPLLKELKDRLKLEIDY
ncbi:MAG: DNA polymerase III subunit gamma/tau, partial [Sphingobacteriia bacterium]